MAVKSFNLKFVIDTDSGLSSIVIPKGLEKFVGSLVFEFLTDDGKLRNTTKFSNKAFRTCCGCGIKTFHEQNDCCVICGRTNIK